MAAMQQERNLMNSGELRDGSNFGQGQMVAADYTLSPSIQFSENTGGASGMLNNLMNRGSGILGLGRFGRANVHVENLEAATTLLLIDNRSGVQVSAAVGSAQKKDWSLAGFSFGGGGYGAAKAYSDTPEGKVIMTAFADSFNKMISALRNYKPQTVKGGLGKGGKLTVGGADDTAPVVTSPQTTVAKVAPSPAPATITKTQPRISKRSTLNIDIEEYDEDALQDYYEALKNTIKLLSTFASSSAEQLKMMDNKMGGGVWMMWSNMVSSQLETSKIELESWPYEARKEGWAVLGNRIVKYNKIFNKHRTTLLANEALEERMKTSLTDFELVTEESLLAE